LESFFCSVRKEERLQDLKVRKEERELQRIQRLEDIELRRLERLEDQRRENESKKNKYH
jgi:hypothetical protein